MNSTELWDLLTELKDDNVAEKTDGSQRGLEGEKQDQYKEHEYHCDNLGCKSNKKNKDTQVDTIFFVEEGQNICKVCYTIQSRFIDQGAEWHNYGDGEKDLARCGLPVNDLLPKSSLGSMIGSSYKESWDARKIRVYQMWNSMPYRERSLYNIFDQITMSSSKHNLTPKIISDAKVLYKRISECKISRGDNREGLIATSIYLACIMNKSPRSPKEVAKIFDLDTTLITRGISRFQNLLKLKIACTSPEDYITRFGSILNMNKQHVDYCKEIVTRVRTMNIISENAPTSIAAGIIFLCATVCRLTLTKKEIHLGTDISEVTITKCFKKMQPFADELFKGL